MKIDWAKHLRIIKKTIVFFICGIILSVGISIILYEPLGNFLNSLSEQQIHKLATNTFSEISRTSFNVYLIAYILFGQLPQKIRKSRWYLRGIYFTIFYLFCYIISIWI